MFCEHAWGRVAGLAVLLVAGAACSNGASGSGAIDDGGAEPASAQDAAVDAQHGADARADGALLDARAAADATLEAEAAVHADAGADAASEAGGDAQAPDAAMVRSGPVTGLLRLVDFETGTLQTGTSAHDGVLTDYANCNGHGPSIEMPAFAYGTHALRASLAQSTIASGGCFSGSSYANLGVEVLGNRNNATDLRADEQYWIGWAVYLPPDTAAPKDDGWRLMTFHDLPGQTVYSAIFVALNPDLSWRVSRDGAVLDGHQEKHFGKATLGSWQEFVARFVPSYDAAKGAFQLWHRVRGESWEEVDNYSGRTVAAADQFPNMVFMSLFHNATTAGDSMATRTVWYDELRIGDHRVQFEDVAPGGATTPP